MKFYIDLSNLMLVDFLTGIQRVVREVTVRLLENKEHEFILLSYSHRKKAFQRLNNERFIRYFTEGDIDRFSILTPQVIEIRDIPSGSVFFDIDSVWNSRLKRSWLFPILKQKGVKIVTQLYDLIPITDPQFCHDNTTANFMMYVGANIKYADLIITNAQTTVKALDDLADKLGVPHKPAIVVPLSADFTNNGAKDTREEVNEEAKEIAAKGKYLLMIGTIEPRKNHSLVIDALENGLAAAGMNAVFAGRIGWNVEELEQRINEHKLLGKNLFFVEKPNDATVDYLYKNAFAVAFPTFNEGFGLPLIEAFMRGTPVVASDIGVLHEVAGDYADYFDPHDKNSLTECVKSLMNDDAKYQSRKERLKSYVPFTWDQSAEAMMKALETLGENPKKVPEGTTIKQLVCLTARNDDILATLPFIEEFMPFITEMVLCTPDKNVEEIKERYKGRLTLKFLTDSQILDGRSLPEDHGTRNFFLRALALRNPIFDDVFIMTDDDYRPLRTITIEDFIKDGAYNAYYSYDLNEWEGRYNRPTSFDLQQFRTKKFLEENGYPTMMYASHQMQVIDRRIYNEMTEKYDYIIDKGVCEWATYFNYGIKTYPDMFRAIPYVSMCWPGTKSDWNVFLQPKEFLFENHYSILYKDGHVFEGLREDFHENVREENQIKIMRFARELQLQQEAKDVYKSYCDSYFLLYRESPSFCAVAGAEDNIAVSAPAYFMAKAKSCTRIPFTIDRNIIERIGSKDITVNYWFVDEAGVHLTPVGRQSIDLNNLSFLLPVVCPQGSERCVMNIRVILEDKEIAGSAAIRAVIV